ncbi:MAG TPA: tachylectin-related carbohydrate-binding protein [Planktothrix sp.]
MRKKNHARGCWKRIFCSLLALFFLLGSTCPVKADPFSGTPGNTQQIVGAFVSVLSMAGPEGAAAAMVATEMQSVMGMLGFFSSPDPVAAALQQINARLDAINQRLDQTDQQIQQIQNQLFQQANLNNTRLLRQQNNAIQLVMTGLKDKPTDNFTKDQLVTQAQQACDTFLNDKDMWYYSDLCVKDNTYGGKSIKAGTMMDPELKTAPTLDVYASALSCWMAAIEYRYNGDKNSVQTNFSAELNRHIAFLSCRPTFNEFTDQPQSLPEQVKSMVRAQYVITTPTPNPTTHQCVLAEYLQDDFARQQTLVGNESYVAQNVTALCNVPAGMQNTASAAETQAESGYGVDVMSLLVTKMQHLRDQGTIREAYQGTFSATYTGAEYIYKVKPDGVLYWQQDKLGIAAIKPGEKTASSEHISHTLGPEVALGGGWTQWAQIIPGGGSTIYAMTKTGQLQWFSHDGSLTGAVKWRGPTVVGSGWNGFTQIIPMGDGVIYGVLPDGTLRWNMHKNLQTGQGGYAGWAQPAVNVGSGWNIGPTFKCIFGGGNGVFYAVTNDGHLKWYRHNYGSPVAMPGPRPRLLPVPNAPKILGMANPQVTAIERANNAVLAPYNASFANWTKSWQGPIDIGTGWNNFTRLWCAGNGHIYGILPTGEVRAYDHKGWENGAPQWGDAQSIGQGWNVDAFTFCRMPSGSEDALVVK